jgi:secreted PhoX family phosphatase
MQTTYTRSDGSTQTNRGNVNGHIIRWREAGGQAAATTFQWDVYLFGAQADAPADVNLSNLTDVNDFSSPDGLCFDRRGMLWIQTDDGAYTDVSNCMMLAAVPGQVGDGGKATAAGGTATFKGAPATDATVRRFLVGPKGCEITGLTLTPDHKTSVCERSAPWRGWPGRLCSQPFW